MEYNKAISALTSGDHIEGFYILKNTNVRTSNTGKPYLSTFLIDKTGSIEARAWDYSGPITSADEGSVVKIRGTVSAYRSTLQLIIDKIRTTEERDKGCFDLSNLVPTAPIDREEVWKELVDVVESLTDEDYQKIILPERLD